MNAEDAEVYFMKRIWPKLVILAFLCMPFVMGGQFDGGQRP